jgi:hypothetical protein
MAEITADRLAEVYMKIRAKRAEIKEAFDAEDTALEEKQKKITSELLRICKATGADSIKTKHGTISRWVKERYMCSDYGPLIDYIKQHDAIHLLEQRVAQKNMKEWIADHQDDLPPAVSCDRAYDIKIYKPRKEIA